MMPNMAECTGLWRRTLLIDTDGSRDTTADVRWLQGITAFVDLRRSGPPESSVQDGFAGWLSQSGDVFHWSRFANLRPPGPHPDAGRMSWDGDTLIEVGVHADYVEHWVRDASGCGRPDSPCWGLTLGGADGAEGLLLRVGDLFALAQRVAERVEISLGGVDGTSWLITDSALPYREGCFVNPRLGGNELRMDDVDEDGTASVRRWIVQDSEGSVEL
jgi:hypothetical protein